jgi:hypothetical protein
MLLNELSEGDDSSSDRRRSQSIGSESESESDASRPTNLDVNGVLGVIIHGPPNKRRPIVLAALHPLHLQQKQKEHTSIEPP